MLRRPRLLGPVGFGRLGSGVGGLIYIIGAGHHFGLKFDSDRWTFPVTGMTWPTPCVAWRIRLCAKQRSLDPLFRSWEQLSGSTDISRLAVHHSSIGKLIPRGGLRASCRTYSPKSAPGLCALAWCSPTGRPGKNELASARSSMRINLTGRRPKSTSRPAYQLFSVCDR